MRRHKDFHLRIMKEPIFSRLLPAAFCVPASLFSHAAFAELGKNLVAARYNAARMQGRTFSFRNVRSNCGKPGTLLHNF